MNDPKAVIYLAIDNPKNTIQYGGVVAIFAITPVTFLYSSFKILFICFPIVLTSLSNNIDNSIRFNHTVSSLGETLTSKLKSPSSNLINSYLFSRIIKLPRKVI